MPECLPKSLGGPGPSGGFEDSESLKGQPKGSKARREADEVKKKEDKELAGHAVKLREQTLAYKQGKVTAAAFYITLAQAFGLNRHTMVPKVK